MPVFKTSNKEVACTPFVTHSIEPVRQASGFVIAAPRTNLVALTVKADYAPLGLVAGDEVYVPQEYANAPWGRKKLNLEGFGEFILVPFEQIALVKVKGA